ncbi:YtxH domain-containing protein [Winogradskyella vidalii]|uniref:YtxH domain-containing protein n=1 Tax=Winogradskyella vidalii TaxID=2615024 RepID=UPI0015CAAD4F|nr:YtxH domain-containing protein [Winogradskyella vidalii]
MSDDNKNLNEDLNDMIGDSKAEAKTSGDKISQKANEFSDDAKQATNDFGSDANKALSDGKNIAIIAHITIIGWIIALIMNGSNKTEIGSFYIRQMLGLSIIGIVLGWIPVLGFLISIVLLVAWIMSLIAAIGGEMKPTFLFGKQFQEWFKSI